MLGKEFCVALAVLGAASAAEFRAGMARVAITPAVPVRMAGFGPRVSPSEGVQSELYAKALALDWDGAPVVIVTADLIGIPRGIAGDVARAVQRRHGIQRDRLLLNASHTHYGPVLREHANWSLELTPQEDRAIAAYTGKLTAQLIALVDSALADRAPARLLFGRGEAGFATNRRARIGDGYRLGVNPEGPVDHTVPVLRVATPGGRTRAVLFGYACHNVN